MSGAVIVLFCICICCYIINIPSVEKEKRLQKQRKDSKKRIYINNFIDEIPELSYYEAKQLQKKLGNIYVEWNDE